MRASDIEIEQVLKLKDNGYYLKVTEIMKPGIIKGKNYIIIKGIYSQFNSFESGFGLIKGFRPRDLEIVNDTN